MRSNAAPTGQVFTPPRRRGLIAYGLLALIFAACGVFSLLYALAHRETIFFIQYLLLALLFIAPLAFFIYRGYSLLKATYAVSRDGLSISWGLRLSLIHI